MSRFFLMKVGHFLFLNGRETKVFSNNHSLRVGTYIRNGFSKLCVLSCFVTFFIQLHAAEVGQKNTEDLTPPTPVSTKNIRIAIIPIEGEIAPATATYLKRAIAQAETEKYDVVVFEINTFGGRLDTTYEIVETIIAMKVPSVSLIKEKAISAGTLIALASPKLYMLDGATIGDVAPIAMGAEGVTMLGEKFQSPLRAKFRALAEKNNYPVKLSEAFVSIDREIVEVTYKDGSKEILTGIEFGDLADEKKKLLKSKKTLVAKGELLTMNSREAKELGFSSDTVDSVEVIPQLSKEIQGDNIKPTFQRFSLLPSEKLLTLYEKFSAILVLLGLAAIYLEVKNPGFGFFGFAAIGIFLFVFFAQNILELANYAELVLLILGFGLLIVEIFLIPGFGIFGIAGITLVLGALVLMFQNFTFPSTPFQLELFKTNIQMIGSLFLIATLGFIAALFIFPKVAFRSPLVLGAVNTGKARVKKGSSGGVNTAEENAKIVKNSDEVSNHSKVTTQSVPVGSSFESMRKYVGKRCKAVSTLRPSGHVELDGKIFDALAAGVFVEEGREVEVCKVLGSTLVVEEVMDDGTTIS